MSETDILALNSPEIQRQLFRSARLPFGTTLSSILSEKTFGYISGFAKAANLSIETFETLKPTFVAFACAQIALEQLGVTDQGVDEYFSERAPTDDKSVTELETTDEQIAILSQLGDGIESELVIESLEEIAQLETLWSSIIEAWRGGDLKATDQLVVDNMRLQSPTMCKRLITDRNKRWMPKLEAMLGNRPVEFVLVCAGHLAGDEGLLALLKNKGYRITQL